MANSRRDAVKRNTEGENLARNISLQGKLEKRPQEIGASFFVCENPSDSWPEMDGNQIAQSKIGSKISPLS
jgi:hypothetical protein